MIRYVVLTTIAASGLSLGGGGAAMGRGGKS